MQDCLQLLIKKLRHLQHGLNIEFRNDKFFHNKLINACNEVLACQYACFKPAESLIDLIKNLRSSIIIYSKSHFHEIESEIYFTDRRYHNNRHFENQYSERRPSSRYLKNFFNRFFFNRFPFSRSSYSNRSFENDSEKSLIPYNGEKKKCFVCDKKRCWSTKHIREEKDASRTRLKDRYYDRFNRSNNRDRFDVYFDQRVFQYMMDYIADYERMDSDADDLADEMGAFTVDMNINYNFKSIASTHVYSAYDATFLFSSEKDNILPDYRVIGPDLDQYSYVFY